MFTIFNKVCLFFSPWFFHRFHKISKQVLTNKLTIFDDKKLFLYCFDLNFLLEHIAEFVKQREKTLSKWLKVKILDFILKH